MRAQLSEQRRTGLMVCVLAVLVLVVIVRRALHGSEMSNAVVFKETLALLLGALAYEVVVLLVVRGANRAQRIIARGWWYLNAAVELAVPLAIMALLAVYGQLGPVAAVDEPVILLIPLVIMLSLLRLRPALSLWSGVGAGAGHALLVVYAISVEHPDLHHYPLLFSYGFMLVLTGIAAAMASGEIRRYVMEAADEAAAREQAKQRLENVERDLSVARDIQRGLLPSERPSLPSFDVAGMNRPADETGGDYYDWQALPDGRVAFVLADVTGHGIGPAMVMAVCRAYSRASAPLVSDLGSLLSRLNALIHADVSSSGRFITLAAAVVGEGQDEIELMSAGHGPLLIYRAATKSVEMFGGDGLPLGIIPDEVYERSASIAFGVGDVLLMTTDGFFEWTRASDREAFGIERLKEALRVNAHEPCETILTRVDEAVRAFSQGAPQGDDVTGVAIKRLR